MSGFAEYGRYDGVGLAELVRRGDVKPAELVEEAIARVEASQPRLNAVVWKFYDEARRAAAGPLSGPFAGVPFFIKDLGAPVAGAPMSQGNRRLAKVTRDTDAEIVKRFRRAGLVFVGKTNVPEFGLAPVTESEALGPCRNPWDLARTPGGSSGGSAAAVAAGLAPMAHATDGGGSIRIPASCCGLVGLKPTRGRTPQGPVVGEIWRGFSTGHALTRSVRDCAALLDATQGGDVGAPYEIKLPERPYLDEVGAAPGKLRVAYASAPFLADKIHPDCVAGVEATVALLRELGHEVVEAAPPIEREPWLLAFMKIICGETRADVEASGRIVGRRLGFADFEAATYVAGVLGKSWSAGDYASAARHLQAWARRVGGVLPRLRRAVDAHLGRAAGIDRRLEVDRRPSGDPRRRRAAGGGLVPQADRNGAAPVGEVPRLHALYAAVQRHRPAGDVAAAALERGRAADRHAVRWALGRPCSNWRRSSKRPSRGSSGRRKGFEGNRVVPYYETG
jgi:amidase